MTGLVLRYEVPVDGVWHALALSGPVLHVDTRNRGLVEVWALDDGGPKAERRFQVFGTGQPLPDGVVAHVGSVITAQGALVWHLFEEMGAS